MKSLIEFLARLFSKPASIEPEPVITNEIVVAKPKTNIMTGRKAIGGVAAASVIAAIVAFIGPWEGRRYVAYQDIVGVWTICEGHTKGVKQGDTATDAQCDEMAAQDVAEHNAGIRQCITRPMPQNVEIAFTSLAFNVGVGAFCGSTALRRYNAGDDAGACEAMNLWNKAGNRVVRGLVNRRAAESALCKES
jgi:lysozyme